MPRKIKVGTRVRLKVPTFFGWTGTGTIIEDRGDFGTLVKDGYPLDGGRGTALVSYDELSVLRDQRPPPDPQSTS